MKVATFDCYGTLIDWEGGAGSFLYSLARRFEEDPPPGRVLRERWEEIQFGMLQGEYAPYREILASSLGAWAGSSGTLQGSLLFPTVTVMWRTALTPGMPMISRMRSARKTTLDLSGAMRIGSRSAYAPPISAPSSVTRSAISARDR